MVYYLKLSKVMVVESIMTIYIYIFDYLIYVQFKINMNVMMVIYYYCLI